MADSDIEGLVELTAPADADVLAIVDDPAGSPATKKITVVNLMKSKTNTIYFTAGFSDTFTAGADDRFLPVSGGTNTGSGGETNVDVKCYEALTLTDIGFNVRVNTRASNSTGSFRDDTVSIGSTTLTASTTGYFETSGLSDVIADDSLINFLIAIAAASGNFSCYGMIVRLTA